MDLDKHDAELKQLCAQKLAKSSKDDDVVERFKLHCLKSRGCAGIKSIGSVFRMFDDSSDRKLDAREFIDGCRGRGIFKMTDQELKEVFSTFDKDGSGGIDFEEFLKAIRPKMNDFRSRIVNNVFDMVASGGMKKRAADEYGARDGTEASQFDSDNIITVDDLMAFYKCEKHPKYQNGEMSKKDVLMQFINNFEADNCRDGMVTRDEFTDYYSGVSASIDEDNYFSLMMTNSWGTGSGNANYKKGETFKL